MKSMRKMVPYIIWLIVISFALWGVENIFVSLQKESKGAGIVFGKTVSFKAFQDALKTAELFSQKKSGEKPSMEELETAAWQNIVLIHQAKTEKISISDAEVRAEIERLFTADGSGFNPEFYKVWVTKTFGESPRLFEERIRDTLRIRELLKRHEGAEPTVSDQELLDAIENQNTQITIEYSRFDDLEKAKNAYAETTKPENWDTQKTSAEPTVQILGPISLDMVSTIMGLKPEGLALLKKLEMNQFSDPILTGDGVSIFRVVNKTINPSQEMDQAAKNEFRNRLAERKKQETFFSWWQGLMSEANIQKFGKPGQAVEPSPAAQSAS